ncbi:MAG: type II toxin-antitoxin system VapC family toxin [Candidatus Omnitrophica bacterium]|nr:type II toxin-antitoxin system VapC family toxin [Candidatus Omnitrophota bacterium]
MRLLLDTHILLWTFSSPRTIKEVVRREIVNPRNSIYVSAVSAWEISIKKTLGKLESPDDLKGAIRETGFSELAVTMDHAIHAVELPRHHEDPFDRMLVAQAEIEHLILVTRDSILLRYGIQCLTA